MWWGASCALTPSSAPAQTLCELFRDEEHARTTASIYPHVDDLVEDLGAAYRTVIAELYAAGCRHVQLDDCTWGMIVDEGYWKTRSVNGATLEEEAERYLSVNNLALRDLPRDLTVNTHVCRGNYHSTYAGSGPYDRVAPSLFARENVHAFFLEFDDERSGGFAPLAEVPEDKPVALGLVTTKSPILEDPEQVIARIHQATEYVPLERLCLSLQCGFASCEIGNKLSEAEQWAKVRLVRRIAEEVWG